MSELITDPSANNDAAAAVPPPPPGPTALPLTKTSDPWSMPPPADYPYYDPFRRASQPDADEFGYSPNKIYGMKRRFSLSAMLAMVVGIGLLLALLKAMNASARETGTALGFVTCTGLCQAFLFAGKRPRRASIIAGGLYWVISSVAISVFDRPIWGLGHIPALIVVAIYSSPLGMILGVFVGELIITLFVVTDAVELSLTRERPARARRR